MKEVRGQVPGTKRNEARTKSAINKSRASGYVRAYIGLYEGVALGIGAQHPRSSTTEVSAVKYGVSHVVLCYH